MLLKVPKMHRNLPGALGKVDFQWAQNDGFCHFCCIFAVGQCWSVLGIIFGPEARFLELCPQNHLQNFFSKRKTKNMFRRVFLYASQSPKNAQKPYERSRESRFPMNSKCMKMRDFGEFPLNLPYSPPYWPSGGQQPILREIWLVRANY